MTRKFVEMPGVRLKFRTSDDGSWLIATIWMDGKPIQEVARLHRTLAPEPGSDVYQSWVDTVSRGFANVLTSSNIEGVKDVTMLRRKANYKGETP